MHETERQITPREARFLTGSTMRHVTVMTFTGALGLMSMFFVDLADLFFLSLLGRTEVTAAIGFAGTVAFVNLSLSIGSGIAAAALVSRNVGAGRIEEARHYATNCAVFSATVSLVISLVVAVQSDGLLRLLGASGEALRLAETYLWTLVPGFVLIATAVAFSFVLRGIGDARRSMYITLVIAIIIAILDPLFIFGLGLGIQGAAIATVLAYLGAFATGLVAVVRVHRFLAPFSPRRFASDLPAILSIAGPAMLTQAATPFANAYATSAIAPFGDDAVAAMAIIGRLIPVTFGIIFALSGSVGPIIGQNVGAERYDRVRETLVNGLKFNAIYTGTTCLIVLLLRNEIARAFSAEGRTLDIVVFFCVFISWSWAFAGMQFVASALFNNTNRATTSTILNWGRATIGTIPLVHWGAAHWGAEGVLVGTGVGAVVFGLASLAWSFAVVNRLDRKAA